MAESAEVGYVARASFVFERARDQEQRAFVAGMGEQVDQRGGDGFLCPHAEQQHDQRQAR